MLNKSMIQGRITKELELRKTKEMNVDAVFFSLAVERNYRGRRGKRTVDYVHFEAYDKYAKIIHKYFEKGDMILIEGTTKGKINEQNKQHYNIIEVEKVYFWDTNTGNTMEVSQEDIVDYHDENVVNEKEDEIKEVKKDSSRADTFTAEDIDF